MKIRQILLDYIDNYLLKSWYKFSKIGVSKNTISYINIIDNIRRVKISKFDTDEYWMESYTSEENLSGIVIKKSSVLTKDELYGFYMKVRFLNDGKYKLKPYIIIDEEIKNLGYILDADAYPHSLVYKKYNIDGSESLRVIIYKDSDFNCHVLKAETVDNNPMELNERELRAFYKKMNQISKDWERDYKITQNLRSRLLFE